MEGHLTVFLLSVGITLVACSHFPLRQYHLINIPMTWHEAQQFCRQHYSDLATFESIEEIQQLPFTLSYTRAWIGLHDDPSSWKGVMGREPNSWRWSATGETSPGGYQVWAADEPNYFNLHQTCVRMRDNGEWEDQSCNTPTGFICFTDSNSGPRSYEFISTLSTWADAQAYCRQHHTDLAVIDGPEQHSDASAKALGSEAWIGLYRVPWAWSDQSPCSFRHWKTSTPNYPYMQHCTIMDMSFPWDDHYCTSKAKVVCQTELTLQSLMRMTMKTGADMTELLNNDQVLQKVEHMLRSHGYTNVKLAWRIRPIKQTTEKKPYPLRDKNMPGKK